MGEHWRESHELPTHYQERDRGLEDMQVPPFSNLGGFSFQEKKFCIKIEEESH